MPKPVGFDQKIQLKHLNFTADELRFSERKVMYTKLEEYLGDDIHGLKSRKNAITILMKIWCLVQPDQQKLQRTALSLFAEASPEEKLLLHWGMILLAYPFFKAVTDEMGNFFKLQNEVPSQQLGRRIKLLYGDRRRVEVALSAVLGSLNAWGVVQRGPRNIYTLARRVEVADVSLKNWLVEVILRVSSYKAMPLEMLTAQNIFFPFDYKLSIAEIDTKKMNIDRQGLNVSMISLRNEDG
jgi:hypothetical protein